MARPQHAPRIPVPVNPFARPLASVQRHIAGMAWELPYLAQIVELLALLAVTAVCLLLGCTIGVASQVSGSLRRLIYHRHRQLAGATPLEGSASAIAIVVFGLVLVPAILIQLPFLCLGWLGARRGSAMTWLSLASSALLVLLILHKAVGGFALVERLSSRLVVNPASKEHSRTAFPGRPERPGKAVLHDLQLLPSPGTAQRSAGDGPGVRGHRVEPTKSLSSGRGAEAPPIASKPAAPLVAAPVAVAPAARSQSEAPVAAVPAPDRQPAPAATLAMAAPHWPRFHGPHGDNISSDTGLLKRWPAEGPRLIWTAKGIGKGYSGVTLAGGLIYTAGNVGNTTTVTALDSHGLIVWQAPIGRAWTESYPGTRGTPTIDGGQIYFESPLGDVACLDAKTGAQLWGLNVLERFAARNITWALAESLLVDGDRVICCPCGQRASVAALDRQSGQTVWAAPTTGEPTAYASPALVEHRGLRLIVAMTAKSLLVVSAQTGALLSRFPHTAQYDVNALMPIHRDGYVFLSSGYRTGSVLLKLNVDGASVSADKVWECRELDNQHGGVILWGNHLYGASHANASGHWLCVDWQTGQVTHAERGVGAGSLTCADGMLYTLSENGRVGLVEASPAGHKLVSEFRLPKGGEGPTWAHPVVCGGRLYLRHGDLLFAYEVRGPQ